MKKQRYYLVLGINFESTLNTGHLIKLAWFDGQIGACPVFSSKRAAAKAAKGRLRVVAISTEDEE